MILKEWVWRLPNIWGKYELMKKVRVFLKCGTKIFVIARAAPAFSKRKALHY